MELISLCEEGDEELLKKSRENDLLGIQSALLYSAEKGDLGAIRTLIGGFGFAKEDIVFCNFQMFQLAAVHGNLDILEWLVTRFNLSEKEVSMYITYPFVMAAHHGHLRILKWLTRYLEPLKECHQEIGPDYHLIQGDSLVINPAFEAAIGNGRIEVLRWMAEQFKLTKRIITKNKCANLLHAVTSGNVSIIEWIISEFQLEKTDVIHNLGDCFVAASERGRIDITELLVKSFKIRGDDLGYRLTNCDNAKLCQWVRCSLQYLIYGYAIEGTAWLIHWYLTN